MGQLSASDKSKLIAAAATVAAIAFVVIYTMFDPVEYGSYFPKCTFLQLTGYKCPGCGSQRMFHALFHGDFASMWSANALLALTWPLVGVLVLAEFNHKRWPRFYRRATSVGVIMVATAVIVVWWVVRNIYGW